MILFGDDMPLEDTMNLFYNDKLFYNDNLRLRFLYGFNGGRALRFLLQIYFYRKIKFIY
jgi:hypothetical protein